MKKFQIRVNQYTFEAELYETPTANEIWENLPLTGNCNIWGEEIYFSIPLSLPQEDGAHTIVEPGELGFWPVGSAFCIFFGPTPVSTGPKPQAYSPVNIFGKIMDDLSALKKVRQGEKIEIIKIS